MRDVYTYTGKLFGYRDQDELYTRDDIHVGRFIEDEVYNDAGVYIGELREGKLITDSTKRADRFTPYLTHMPTRPVVFPEEDPPLPLGYKEFPDPETFAQSAEGDRSAAEQPTAIPEAAEDSEAVEIPESIEVRELEAEERDELKDLEPDEV